MNHKYIYASLSRISDLEEKGFEAKLLISEVIYLKLN